jgi:ubiquinone/menaquinone biosynthesis C-methylase UbiE
MKSFYEKATGCLVCYKEHVGDSFWDNHWGDTDIATLYKSLSKYNLITRITKKYLSPKDGPILEGGCGVGQFVYSLSKAEYECVGVDVARATIANVKNLYPSLNLRVMDIRKIDFPNNYFAGYWSLGVIEHYIEGYNKILDEMFRVVQPGGYIFVQVPIMCLLRRLKALFGLYETAPAESKNNFSKANFYQFVFPPRKLINDFTKQGLELVEMRSNAGIKGLGDEVVILKARLRFISELRNKNIVLKGLVKLLDLVLSPVTGHMRLFVFKKP